MNTNKITNLFTRYLQYFKTYNLAGIASCYHLPCTLNTPDKLTLVVNEQECHAALGEIFTQLKEAETSNIVARKASYQQIDETVFLVSIDWDFFDGNQQIFADFTALYHVLVVADELKIMNVISHELSNSLSLEHSFSISVTA
ncbi:hypothetical protein GCM10009111_27910 [Colwellia asteriadis]|uniref:Uncharacterized protein n=1 Tax=Colwellia asteriadis TaxID=517723 RepID=A0ABN1L9L0_9GAMM